MKKRILGVIIAILACELAGGIGSIFTAPAISGWYAGLVRGPLNPPNWIFGPVWTSLFALMGVAVFLVWEKRKSPGGKIALAFFLIQMVLNVLWSILFFGARSPLAAFVEIIFLWLAILGTIIAFKKISFAAALLLLPYLAWVSFAAYLNYYIMILN